MPAGDWVFHWANHAASSEQFHLPCVDERVVSFNLMQPGTVELKVPVNTDVGRHIALGTGWGYVLAYQNGTLRGVYETVSTDVGPRSGEGLPSVAIVGTESAYVRAANTLLDANKPYVFPATAGNVGTRFDSLINAAPIWGLTASGTSSGGSVNPSTFEQGIDLLTLIQAFAWRGSGFDFTFLPRWTTTSGFRTVGEFYAATTIGSTMTSNRFEFGAGTRANLTEYSWKRLGGDHLVNVVYVPSNGSSDANATGVKSAADVTSINAYGLRAKWVTADFEDATLRQSLADDHLLYRKNPRRILNITPNVNDGSGLVPKPLVDYEPGMTVPVTIKDSGQTIIDANVRIYGIKITLDKDGKETVALETSPETAA